MLALGTEGCFTMLAADSKREVSGWKACGALVSRQCCVPGSKSNRGSQDWAHSKIFFVRDRRRDKGFRLDASALRSDLFLVFLPGVVATPILFTVEDQDDSYESKQVKQVTPGSEPLFGFALVVVGSRAVVWF